MLRKPTTSLVVICFISVASAAKAQMYRCSSGHGTYLSDRSCTSSSAPLYASPSPSAPQAHEHIKYLSPTCASISEGIRTGPARGVKWDVIQGLHAEYREKCALEDQEARSRVSQEKSAQHKEAVSQREARVRLQQDMQAQVARCASMRDVITLKRKREHELNPTEIQALRNLERTYNEQCLQR